VTIHVLLPVHNRIAMTEEFLASLDAQSSDEPRRVIVVDDGSTDGTAERVGSRPDTSVITGDGSLWWAGAVHRAVETIRAELTDADWVYLGNNDTVLKSDHVARLLETAQAMPRTLVGSVSFEIWPDGHRHPVATGFMIDAGSLEVTNIPGDMVTVVGADALAGRGLLIPASAARRIIMKPRRMPQHFADLAMTSDLRRQGFSLVVQPAALSTQLERAGSSVEIKPRLGDALGKRSQLYLPAMWQFWWDQSTPAQRATLPFRFASRGVRQARGGSYALS
jgi:GT2 family glycosyltransferase